MCKHPCERETDCCYCLKLEKCKKCSKKIYKRIVSWGFGNDSTYLVEHLINQGDTDFIIVASDPKYEMDRTYEVTIPFYKKRWEEKGLEVHIISREYGLYDYFYNKKQVPLGWVNPFCSSHFKRDLIRAYYRSLWGIENKSGKKVLYGRTHVIEEMIGHTLEEKNRIKYFKTDQWLKRSYPNFDNGITKDFIKQYWKDNNLPEPMKSSCWFCPNRSSNYFKELKMKEPDKFNMILELEENAEGLNGKPAPTLKNGLKMKDLDITDFPDDSILNCSSYCYT